jgi:hypothetical protein
MLPTLGGDRPEWLLAEAIALLLRHRRHHNHHNHHSMSASNPSQRAGMPPLVKAPFHPAGISNPTTGPRTLTLPSETQHNRAQSRCLGPLPNLCKPIFKATMSDHPPESPFCSGFKRGWTNLCHSRKDPPSSPLATLHCRIWTLCRPKRRTLTRRCI